MITKCECGKEYYTDDNMCMDCQRAEARMQPEPVHPMILGKEKPVRKLRDDITRKEILEWIDHGGPSCATMGMAVWRLVAGFPSADYPASFYEQPEVGSFGKFGQPDGHFCWGYLTRIDSDIDDKYELDNGSAWRTFTPGLPTDVDAEGLPK